MEAGRAAEKAPRTAAKELDRLIGGTNKRQMALDILRTAKRPLSTAECAQEFATRHGLSGDDPRVALIENRLSSILDALQKAGRVRHAGMLDGNRRQWEIAASVSGGREGPVEVLEVQIGRVVPLPIAAEASRSGSTSWRTGPAPSAGRCSSGDCPRARRDRRRNSRNTSARSGGGCRHRHAGCVRRSSRRGSCSCRPRLGRLPSGSPACAR